MGWFRATNMERETFGNRAGRYAQNMYVKKVLDMKTIPGCRLVPLTDEGTPDLLSACAYSSGGSTHKPLLAVGGESGHLFVYTDAASIPSTHTEPSPEALVSRSMPQKRLPVHRGLVFDVSWAGNSHVLSAGGDSTVQLTDIETGVSRTFNGHKGSVRSCRFQQDSTNIFVSCSRDGAIALWDTRIAPTKEGNVQPTRTIADAHSNDVRSVSAQSACGAFFVGTSQAIVSAGVDGLIKLWDARASHKAKTSGSEACMGYIPHYGEGVRPRAYTSLDISHRDGDTVVANCLDQRLYVFELSRSVRYTHSTPGANSRSAEHREDGPINIFSGHGFSSFYSKANLNCSDSLVACGGRQGQVYLYQLRGDTKPIAVLENGHAADARGECAVDGIAWSPEDPFQLAVCSEEGFVRLWGTSDRGGNAAAVHNMSHQQSTTGRDVAHTGVGVDVDGVSCSVRDERLQRRCGSDDSGGKSTEQLKARKSYSTKDWKARVRSRNSAIRRSPAGLEVSKLLRHNMYPEVRRVYQDIHTGRITDIYNERDALNTTELREDSIVYAVANGTLADKVYSERIFKSCASVAPTLEGSTKVTEDIHTATPDKFAHTHTHAHGVTNSTAPSDTPFAGAGASVGKVAHTRLNEHTDCERGKDAGDELSPDVFSSGAATSSTHHHTPGVSARSQRMKESNTKHHPDVSVSTTQTKTPKPTQHNRTTHTPHPLTPRFGTGHSSIHHTRRLQSLIPSIATVAHADTHEASAQIPRSICGTQHTRATLRASGATLHQLANKATLTMVPESRREVWERTRVHSHPMPFSKSKANRDIRSFFQTLQPAATKSRTSRPEGDENKPPPNGTKLIARTRKGTGLQSTNTKRTATQHTDKPPRGTKPLGCSNRVLTSSRPITTKPNSSTVNNTSYEKPTGHKYGSLQQQAPAQTRNKALRRSGGWDKTCAVAKKRAKTNTGEGKAA